MVRYHAYKRTTAHGNDTRPEMQLKTTKVIVVVVVKSILVKIINCLKNIMANGRGRSRCGAQSNVNNGSAFAAAFAVAAAAEPTLPNIRVPPPTHAAMTALLNAAVANNALPPQ